jgi:hypothetical protein
MKLRKPKMKSTIFVVTHTTIYIKQIFTEMYEQNTSYNLFYQLTEAPAHF